MASRCAARSARRSSREGAEAQARSTRKSRPDRRRLCARCSNPTPRPERSRQAGCRSTASKRVECVSRRAPQRFATIARMTSTDLHADDGAHGRSRPRCQRPHDGRADGGEERRVARARAPPAREAARRCRPANARDLARRRGSRPGRAAGRPPAADADRSSRPWPKAASRSPRCPTRSARSPTLRRRPSGISVGRMRVPLGVFGMIYESRPNVTIEAASLAIKSGNACILRGGSEAIHSNLALWQLVQARAGRGRPAARRGAAGRDHRPRRGRPPDRDARSAST